MENKEETNKTTKTTIGKNKKGYGYKYTDLAQIHEYLESMNIRYYQYVDRIDNDDYIMTVPIIDGKQEEPRRGVRIVDAVLSGIKNPAQEQGSATSYARRYSLLMAFGLATEDDDAQSLTKKNNKKEEVNDFNLGEPVYVKSDEKQLELVGKLMDYELKGENLDVIKDAYKVNSINDMSISQLEQALKRLKEKYGE